MKFSFRQILASAAGAVIAALIASSFGVTGTIVGVAIGSMAATLGTALVSQSIERGQKAVKQAVVRVPDGPTSTLLRRMGGTGAAGGATSSVDGAPTEPEHTEVVGTLGEETVQMRSAGAPVDATERVDTSPGGIASETPVTDFLESAAPLPPTAVVAGAGVSRVSGSEGVARAAGNGAALGGRRFSWKAFAGTVAIVFVLALGFVTAVELIANKATVFTPSSPGTPTTTTTSTPPTTSTSTNQTTSSTTTSTTATTSTTTSTTAPSTTTTTNHVRSATTTTIAAP